jgi:hypothetical protein
MLYYIMQSRFIKKTKIVEMLLIQKIYQVLFFDKKKQQHSFHIHISIIVRYFFDCCSIIMHYDIQNMIRSSVLPLV